jgi:hypothetical protein
MGSHFEKKSMLQPDKTEQMEKGKVDAVMLNGVVFMRHQYEPGFHAAESLKPMGLPGCPYPHVMLAVSGRGVFTMLDDGKDHEFSAGDVINLDGNHDMRVLGEEPAVFIEPSMASAK